MKLIGEMLGKRVLRTRFTSIFIDQETGTLVITVDGLGIEYGADGVIRPCFSGDLLTDRETETSVFIP